MDRNWSIAAEKFPALSLMEEMASVTIEMARKFVALIYSPTDVGRSNHSVGDCFCFLSSHGLLRCVVKTWHVTIIANQR